MDFYINDSGFKASHSYFHLWLGGLILQCCLITNCLRLLVVLGGVHFFS